MVIPSSSSSSLSPLRNGDNPSSDLGPVRTSRLESEEVEPPPPQSLASSSLLLAKRTKTGDTTTTISSTTIERSSNNNNNQEEEDQKSNRSHNSRQSNRTSRSRSSSSSTSSRRGMDEKVKKKRSKSQRRSKSNMSMQSSSADERRSKKNRNREHSSTPRRKSSRPVDPFGYFDQGYEYYKQVEKRKNNRDDDDDEDDETQSLSASSYHLKQGNQEQNPELQKKNSSKTYTTSATTLPVTTASTTLMVTGSEVAFASSDSATSINHGNNNDSNEENFEEECELLNDTFTFLMTSRYPLDFCWNKNESGTEQENKYNKHQQETKELIEEEEEVELKEDMGDNAFDNSERRDREKGFSLVLSLRSSKKDDHYDNEIDRKIAKEKRREKVKQRLERADPDYLCLPFWLGFLVNVSQLFIYTVVMANVFVDGSLPPNADRWLRLAQLFAVTVTLYTQSDFIDGVFLLTERWKQFKGITTPLKFNISAVTRVFAGFVGIISTFILVIYSTEVVDLLLNFTAMEFVAVLDDSAFEIAAKGFLGITLEKKCMQIKDFKYRRRVTKHGSWTRFFAYAVSVALVFISFLWVVILQSNRRVGIANEVYIQFDDTEVPDLFGISGVYVGCQGYRTKHTGDIGYVDISYAGSCPPLIPSSTSSPSANKKGRRHQSMEFPSKIFVYCWPLDGWVFLDKPTDDPCNNFLLRSFLDETPLASNSFDILTNSQANWVAVVRDGNGSASGGESFLDFVFMEAIDSYKNTFKGCRIENKDQEDEDSIIGEGLLSLHSNLDSLKQAALDPLPEDSSHYPYFAGRSYIDIFGLMYRPIFQKKIRKAKNKYQVVLFDGIRWYWIFLNPSEFAKKIGKEDECDNSIADNDDNYSDDDDDNSCWNVFVKYFHRERRIWMFDEQIAVLRAMSDPMKFLTPDDTGVPTDSLVWYQPVVKANLQIVRSGQIIDDSTELGNITGTFGFECASIKTRIECGPDEEPFRIEYVTDTFSGGTGIWMYFGQDPKNDFKNLLYPQITIPESYQTFMINHDALTFIQFSPDDANVEIVLESCIPKQEVEETCLQIILFDDFGDGLISGGYDFFIGEELVMSYTAPGPYYYCKVYHIGAGCDESLNMPTENEKCDLDYYLEHFPTGTEPNPGDFFFTDDFASLSITDTPFETDPPTPAPKECRFDETPLTIRLTTDTCISEIFLLFFYGQSADDLDEIETIEDISADIHELIHVDIPEKTVVRVTFSVQNSKHFFAACVPNTRRKCIQIVVMDSYGDGLHAPGEIDITFGDKQSIIGAAESYSCLPYQVGSGCTNNNGATVGVVDYSDRDECNIYEVLGPVTTDPPTPAPFECGPDSIPLDIRLTTDLFPRDDYILIFYGQQTNDLSQEIEHFVSSSSVQTLPVDPNERVVFNVGKTYLTNITFNDLEALYSLTSCIPNHQSTSNNDNNNEIEQCIQVIIVDNWMDGFAYPGGYELIFGDDNSNIDGGKVSTRNYNLESFACRQYQFGSGCATSTTVAGSLQDQVNYIDCGYLFDQSNPINNTTVTPEDDSIL